MLSCIANFLLNVSVKESKENRSIFSKDMDKSIVSPFFLTHGVVLLTCQSFHFRSILVWFWKKNMVLVQFQLHPNLSTSASSSDKSILATNIFLTLLLCWQTWKTGLLQLPPSCAIHYVSLLKNEDEPDGKNEMTDLKSKQLVHCNLVILHH